MKTEEALKLPNSNPPGAIYKKMKKLGIAFLVTSLALSGLGCKSALLGAAVGAGTGMLVAENDLKGALIGGAAGAIGGVLIEEILKDHKADRSSYRYSWIEIQEKIDREYNYLFNRSIPKNLWDEDSQRKETINSVKRAGDMLFGNYDKSCDENELKNALYEFREAMKARAKGNLESYINENNGKVLIQVLTEGRYEDFLRDKYYY